MVEQRIKNTVKKLDREAKKIHTQSMAFRFGYDYTFLANLLDDMKIEDLKVREDLTALVPDELLEIVGIYLDDLGVLAQNVISVYKDANFYCYLRQGHATLSDKDKKAILREYIMKKMPWAYDLYKDLYDEGHIFLSTDEKNYGSAYLLPLIDEYYISLNKYLPDDLGFIETTIHELMHVFIAKLSSSYSWQNHHNIVSGFSKESASIYSSLSFYDFCLENHICVDNAMLNRNFSDYDILTYFKLIHYFYEMAEKRKEMVTISEGINYEFQEKFMLEEDKGVPFFQYHEDDCYKDSFINFVYATGSS